MENLTIEKVSLALGFIILLIGVWGALTQKNIIKMIIAFTLFDTGLNIVIVALGYIKNKTAPILDSLDLQTNTVSKIVDAVPQALVLTSIVIGVGVTALKLIYALRLYKEKKTLNINDYKDLKW